MEADGRMITKQELDDALERVMNNVLLELKMMREESGKRFDRIESRLDRQAGLIQSGARALLRIDRWADDSDRRFAELSDQVQTLEGRVSRLERH
jgi:hypothetical protein